MSTGRDDPFDVDRCRRPRTTSARRDPEAQAQGEYNLRVRLLRVESKVEWQAADGRRRDVRLATLVLGAKP